MLVRLRVCFCISLLLSGLSSRFDPLKSAEVLASSQFVALPSFIIFYNMCWNLVPFQSFYNEHFTCKTDFVNNDQDTALICVSPPSLSVSVLSLCRGRGISLGWRQPALQNLWEVEGKIKPSSRCQGRCRWRHMEMIYDVVITKANLVASYMSTLKRCPQRSVMCFSCIKKDEFYNPSRPQRRRVLCIINQWVLYLKLWPKMFF